MAYRVGVSERRLVTLALFVATFLVALDTSVVSTAMPINQTILGDVYPLEERARITGVFSTIWGISGLLGPAIGGFLTEHVSWRWVFYVNFPLCILSIVLLSRFFHERLQRRGHSID